MTASEPSAGISRRRLLAGGLAAGAGLVVSGVGGFALGRASDALDPQTQLVPYYGPHQAGIATAAQERLQFAAFDILTDRRDDLRDLLKTWTAAAVAMTAGNPLGDPGSAPLRPPADTGEAVGLGAARLTTTIGFGPSMFGRPGHDRFGFVSSVRPRWPTCRRPRWPTCRRSLMTNLTRAAATATCASRRAPRTPRLRSTRFVTWPGSAEGSSQSAGPSWVSAEPPAPLPPR